MLERCEINNKNNRICKKIYVIYLMKLFINYRQKKQYIKYIINEITIWYMIYLLQHE